ncbi:carbohydrate ABC transporter permease [Salinisphaera sp. Q1T1-3]|uniref:carbohydrate ABC transporter permease n=1 Tax=Salinisphaera sp. Q1T1-3 TaxID=2321229 RepID=UPI000E7353B2|nr:carbohydrate ABC transporter permease [Salinisphaera sp. Q1T1-3]RJS93100.1 carbohydrate ABC transporter permease [Salinisphaera sp. Q1T1-3]
MAARTEDGVARGGPIARCIVYGILMLAAAYFLLPLYVMLTTSFKTLPQIANGSLLSLPSPFSVSAWGDAWSSACTGGDCNGLHHYFWNSVAFTAPAVALSTAFGALNGYVLTKWRFKGSELIFGLLLVGTFVPFQMFLLPMARVLGIIGLDNSVAGLTLVHTVYGIAFTTLFCRNYYVAIPDELVKAARIDGASFISTFRHVILPISTPILMVCVIWQFTQIWNDFLFGVVFTSGDAHPITVALNNLVNTSSTGVKRYNVDMAGAIITALPTLLVYIVAGRYFMRGLTAGAVKG